jgi:hypothetical protein
VTDGLEKVRAAHDPKALKQEGLSSRGKNCCASRARPHVFGL